MECTTNNRVIITEGEGFEVKQVEPARGCIDNRINKLSLLGSDTGVMEMALIEKELETAKGKEKTALEAKKKELENKVDFSKPNKIMQETNRELVVGSIKGNLFEKGYFKVAGEEIDITEENISMLPNAVYNELLSNAEKLSNITEAEEKN